MRDDANPRVTTVIAATLLEDSGAQQCAMFYCCITKCTAAIWVAYYKLRKEHLLVLDLAYCSVRIFSMKTHELSLLN